MHTNGTPPHILCVNHSPDILDLLRDLFESEGYRVSTQTAVEQDLDAVVALAPDLVTIDDMWPSSGGDWPYLTLVRTDPRTRDIPVILCTGAVGHVLEMEDHLVALGVRVVFKPFDIEVLLEVVRERLEARKSVE